VSSVSIERDGDGNDLRYFVHTPAGALLYSIDAATDARNFYHFDETGSTIAVSDDDGVVVGSYAYTPYGEIVAATGSMDNPYTWLGQFGVMDEGNGLYSMRARYYDSATGRFLSRDPLETTNPMGINPYQYGLGNPLRFFDPLGMETELYDEGYKSMGLVAADFFAGAGPKEVKYLYKIATQGDVPLSTVAKDLTKKFAFHHLSKEFFVAEKNLPRGLKLTELLVNILLVIHQDYQNSLEQEGINEVNSFQFERLLNADVEAKQALRDRDPDALADMNPLARDALRVLALQRLIKTRAELDGLREVAGELRVWNPSSKIERLEEYEYFLLEAVAGEFVPGEDPDEFSPFLPSVQREAATDPSLGR